MPSARFRVRRLVAPMGRNGIGVAVIDATGCASAPVAPKAAALVGAYAVPAVLRSRRFDVSLIQRGPVTTLIARESFADRACVLQRIRKQVARMVECVAGRPAAPGVTEPTEGNHGR